MAHISWSIGPNPASFLDITMLATSVWIMLLTKLFGLSMSSLMKLFFFFFPTKDQVTSHLPSEISAQGDAPIFLPVNLTLSPGLVTTLEPPAARSTHAPSLTPAAGNPAASLV
jgi:hypothetical protein